MGRERQVPIPTGQNLVFVDGTTVSFFLPLVYLYKKLIIRLSGTLTMTGATGGEALSEDTISAIVAQTGIRLTGQTPYLSASGYTWREYALKETKFLPNFTNPVVTDGANAFTLEIPIYFTVPSSPLADLFAFPAFRQDQVELFIQWNTLASLVTGGTGNFTASNITVDLLASVDDQQNVTNRAEFLAMRRIERTHNLASSPFVTDGEEYILGRSGVGGIREVMLISRDAGVRSDSIVTRYEIEVSRQDNQEVPFANAQDLFRSITQTAPETGLAMLTWDRPDARMENSLPISGETELLLKALHGTGTPAANVVSLFEEELIGTF